MPVRFTDEDLALAVAQAVNYSEVCRLLGKTSPSGGTLAHVRKRIAAAGLDISHFTFRPRHQPPHVGRLDHTDVFVSGVRRRRSQLLRALLEIGVPYECALCANPGEWQGALLPLEIDHIDGDRTNHARVNLRLLCPNCHSQQATGTSAAALAMDAFELDHAGSARRKRISVSKPVASRPRRLRTDEKCPACSGRKDRRAGTCRNCRHQGRAPKIDWPDEETLLARLRDSSYLALARELGVSDTAIRQRLRSRGVTPPTKYPG